MLICYSLCSKDRNMLDADVNTSVITTQKQWMKTRSDTAKTNCQFDMADVFNI